MWKRSFFSRGTLKSDRGELIEFLRYPAKIKYSRNGKTSIVASGVSIQAQTYLLYPDNVREDSETGPVVSDEGVRQRIVDRVLDAYAAFRVKFILI